MIAFEREMFELFQKCCVRSTTTLIREKLRVKRFKNVVPEAQRLLLAPAAIEQQQLFIIHQRLNVTFLAIIKNISTGEFSYKTLT